MGQSTTKAGVVVWGSSEHGQLGLGGLTAEDRCLPPRLVEGLRSVSVRHVVCGGRYCAAVSESGEVYTWGHGKDGQLGHGETKDCYAPKAVRALQSKLIRQISCAEHHCAAVSEAGVLFTWGMGQNGRLGHGGTENELLPKTVESLLGHHVGQVSCGDFHNVCIILGGSQTQVFSWGLGLSGRLGHGHEKDCLVPTLVEALAGVHIAAVACGGHHSSAIKEPGGQLMTWGGGAFGKLGHGNRLAQTTPKLVVAVQGKKNVQVALGPHHSAVLTQKGEVFTWGQAGRLGHASQGAEVDEMVPRQVIALSGVFVIQVACGHSHCAVVTETGDVWAWGSSRTFGHTEPNAVANVPTMIKVLSGKAIVQVACGVTHSMALSDYRRLAGKVAANAARSTTAGGNVKEPLLVRGSAGLGGVASGQRGRGPGAGEIEDPAADLKKPERSLEADGSALGRGGGGGHREGIGGEERSGLDGTLFPGDSGEGLHVPTLERELAFMSAECKAYQERTLTLAKLLQETKSKLDTLQNENSFLKSELEVMHQCSNDADERFDTLRRHFKERIYEMERRYMEKERTWKEVLHRLRSHLDVGAMDAFPSGVGGHDRLGGLGLGALGNLGALSDHGASSYSDLLPNQTLGGEILPIGESGGLSGLGGAPMPGNLAGEEPLPGGGLGAEAAGPNADGRGGGGLADAGAAGGRAGVGAQVSERVGGRASGRVTLWPGAQS